jgi:hypothetical protein
MIDNSVPNMNDDWVKAFRDSILHMKADQVETHARICAIEELLMEVLSRLNETEAQQWKAVLDEKKRRWHDQLLLGIGDTNPLAASNLDRRGEEDLPAEDEPT